VITTSLHYLEGTQQINRTSDKDSCLRLELVQGGTNSIIRIEIGRFFAGQLAKMLEFPHQDKPEPSMNFKEFAEFLVTRKKIRLTFE